MIDRNSFSVFNDPTLPGRLKKIQTDVDPDFETMGQNLIDLLHPQLDQKMYLHVAKHLRRHKNPPVDTWFALSASPRGYKMLPHFEVGIWPDTLFITFACLSEMTNREVVVDWLTQQDWQIIPAFQISMDHTSAASEVYSQATWEKAVDRYRNVQKSDFLLGTWIKRDDSRFAQPKLIEQLIYNQVIDLAPVYQEVVGALKAEK
ncbi:hypothetical protein FC15_GL001811 [Lapidilactobacillus concavus DSM 17758]|uniref:Uncharacterized protein n=1 Tax=Lapidilactobacillus concavus DSM 17758 TaxID=1423735 RepID=A0A0R1VYR5_9LACO|nr:DUF1054 family protein [Lapidilactobacillus concavus]KRM09019.1 hypothetical protein FC15_GL001811 [Lapidilactobacillus concavus DSM 17758]GEL13827.1 UPF0637 protein [Lapidilactobacillus concavus]